MARHVSDAHRRASALQAARRMVARGERGPATASERAHDGSWTVDGLPGVTVTAETRKAALTAARTAITAVLEVDPEAFDLEG